LRSGVKLSLLSGLVYYSQHPAALSHGILAPSLSLDDTKVRTTRHETSGVDGTDCSDEYRA
jgi:hypothetical protein